MLKLNLTNLTGSANISVNINASVTSDNKINAYVTVNRTVNTAENPSSVRTEESYNYSAETPGNLISKIETDLGIGVLVE